ncbi:MAG: DUF3570 domain-containing protein [Pseudomonadota bacterium]
MWMYRSAAAAVLLAPFAVQAEVLPEDRADVMYHRYEGDNITIEGPSLVVRKNLGSHLSMKGTYYVDSITSASIDVVTNASAYTEERTETGFGVDYLRGRTTVSMGFSNSDENDFTAQTGYLQISQGMFGDLTTVSMGYSQGKDEVRRTGDDAFLENAERRNFRLGLTQILTRKLILGLNYEGITDEGYLNNPYRTVRYLNDDGSFSFQPEQYPNTRTSNAASVTGRYHLPVKGALYGDYRWFEDTWGIGADTYQVGYTQEFGERWTLDAHVRMYSQNSADFYSDLFPRENAQNFLARDKELSTFQSQTFGIGLRYEFAQNGLGFIDRGTINLKYDHIQFNYDDFRNIPAGGNPGEEPLFEFTAGVVQFFMSLWF